MRRRTLTFSAAALASLASLAALAPAESRAASAAELNGWIGGEGIRSDYWAQAYGRTYNLHLAGALSANGYFLAPGDIDWTANGALGGDRASYPDGSTTDTTLLTYGGRLAFFDTRRSSFKLRLAANRVQSDFSQTPPGSEARPGSSITNDYAAEVVMGGGAYPLLSVRGSYDDSDYRNFQQPTIHRQVRALDANATHGTDDFTWGLGYSGRLETGNLEQNEYASHYLTANGTARLADQTSLTLNGQYYTRTPHTWSPFSPKYDDTNVGATLTGPFFGLGGNASYGFAHLVFEAPGFPTTEQTSHVLNAYGTRVLAPEWTLRPSASASFTDARSGTEESNGATQTVGTGLEWARTQMDRTYVVNANGQIGANEVSNGPTTGAYGVGAGGLVSQNTSSGTYGGAYNFALNSNLGGVRGWLIAQGITGNYNAVLGPQMPLGASLVLSTTRTHSDLIGDGATRTANLYVNLGVGRRAFGLQGYLNQGVAPALGSPVRGDGLVVPFGYDVSSRGVVLSAMSPLFARWEGVVQVRYGLLTAPQLASTTEFTALGRLNYRIGEFTLSLEDTYRAYHTVTNFAYNTVMVTFARSFRL